tara:strand:- start:1210 stop:1536 length:327 start_codon:yes stop_codon:yes gene_type:complete
MQKERFKMGKLSKAKAITETEKFCVEGMLQNGMSIEDVAKAIGRPEEMVQELVEEYEQESGPRTINETASGNRGVSIMTEAGSYKVDEARKRDAPERDTTSTIHKINE